MTDIKKIMELSVNNLAEEQHFALKNHVVLILKNVLNLIEKDQYDIVLNYLSFSPSGDCMGCDNHYIDFSWNNTPMDIAEVCEVLSSLKLASGK